ncbi:PAPA-1 domain-containing protein [Mycena sanguinolenta]|uniref:PAPA-1 domain-containing protein n=1 Tax=Mycena sanguinolenta TaxID=230812 RepID=A0A8H7D088_9AGAR|nr:PAPA-1 domain-containing protein [Mycena sanguinolenta]
MPRREVDEGMAQSEEEQVEAAEGEGDVEEPEEYELEDEDDEIQESRSPSVLAPPPKSPLKIKFKVRASGGTVTRGRRTRATAVQVESEDSDESSEEEMPQNVRLTKRQAALAKARRGGVASSDTSADDDAEPAPSTGTKKRGAPLDPSELALRKEESARKRRNVSEKKLQNEKAETINRLLKKQSRPRTRNRRGFALSTPVEVPTPWLMVTPTAVRTRREREGREKERGRSTCHRRRRCTAGSRRLAPPPPPPIAQDTEAVADETGRAEPEGEAGMDIDPVPDSAPRMTLSFSIPVSASSSSAPTSIPTKPTPEIGGPENPRICAMAECDKPRRYRLVRGPWGVGACGMEHLKQLEQLEVI